MKPQFEIYKTRNGYRWRLRAANDEFLAFGNEVETQDQALQTCMNAASVVNEAHTIKEVKEPATLKALRKKAGMTQAEAAEAIGVSDDTIIRWESGQTYPTVPDIQKIEVAYGVKYESIDFGVEIEQ